jgi:hypothetical protein
MRTPHPIETHPAATPPSTTYTNPYDELGALDDGPLEEFLHEENQDDQGLDETGEDRAPPNHRRGARTRRRRNRFAGLPLALKAVIGLVVLAAFLTLADRWALLYAEHAAADKLEPGGVEGRKPRKGAGAAGQQPVNRTQFTAPSRFHQRRLRKPGSAVKPHTCGCGGVLIPCGPLKPTRRQ